MTEPHRPERTGESPAHAMMVSMTGAGASEHETEPPGASVDSVRAGHEPDRFEVRAILYVPLVVVIVLVLAYLLTTWLFAVASNQRAAADAKALKANPDVVKMNALSSDERFGVISSTNPKAALNDPNTGVAQPRVEGMKQTRDDPGFDPSYYRSKLPDPEGNNPIDVRPEDLRPENYVAKPFDPSPGTRILATYGWADEGKRLARVPVNTAIRMVAEKKLKLPVRKDPVKPPETSVDKARQSNAGRGGQPPAAAPKGGEHKDDKPDGKAPEKK